MKKNTIDFTACTISRNQLRTILGGTESEVSVIEYRPGNTQY